MKPFIVCEHADFGYENQDAVVDLSITIDPGDYLCIVGANGSGKSTLIKGLLGLLAPTAGTLIVAEELRRGGIGYLPQQTAAQRDFPATVSEVVLSGTLSRRGNRPFYSQEERRLARQSMERLGITELKKQCYRELSGGQQQRVGIARALVVKPKIIFADEPTGNLDSKTTMEVLALMRRIVREQKQTLVMVTHDNHLATYADRQFHIVDGKILKIEERQDKEELEDI
mgnify:CR=1 FL=1